MSTTAENHQFSVKRSTPKVQRYLENKLKFVGSIQRSRFTGSIQQPSPGHRITVQKETETKFVGYIPRKKPRHRGSVQQIRFRKKNSIHFQGSSLEKNRALSSPSSIAHIFNNDVLSRLASPSDQYASCFARPSDELRR